MILIWGLPGDRPAASVHRALERGGCPVMLLDQRKVMETDVELSLGDKVEGRLHCDSRTMDLADVTAVYARPYDIRRLPALENAKPGDAVWRHASRVEDMLLSWLDLTPALVVNPFAAMATNNSKPYQAAVIRRFGFRTPATLITTDPEAALEFWGKYESVIYKSISGVRSIVSKVTTAHRERLQDVASCPTQFQEFVAGVDHRVHVVGDEIYACRIQSDADDYRYASRQDCEASIEACELPADLNERCLALTRELGLHVAGLDLRLTPNGEWCCFEVNPSPGFTYFQEETKQPIDDAIARLLAG